MSFPFEFITLLIILETFNDVFWFLFFTGLCRGTGLTDMILTLTRFAEDRER